MPDFRCSAASLADAEPMAGSAPSDSAWLLVEYPGPWGRQAVAESRLPGPARRALTGPAGFRVQLIRRPGATTPGAVQVFAATATPSGFAVGADRLAGYDAVPDLVRGLDPAAPAGGLPSYADPLWLVCTNGRRDRCCAEQGRAVLRAVAGEWPHATWETTHLGGHRFAGTLLALPGGLTLGRLSADTAVAVCRNAGEGRPSPEWTRGRAGRSPAAQVAELHVRSLGLPGPLRVTETCPGRVEVSADEAAYEVTVHERPGPACRQSCADDAVKPTSTWVVASSDRLR